MGCSNATDELSLYGNIIILDRLIFRFPSKNAHYIRTILRATSMMITDTDNDVHSRWIMRQNTQGQSPTTKISPVETNPENTHSHKIAHISSSRDDKSYL